MNIIAVKQTCFFLANTTSNVFSIFFCFGVVHVHFRVLCRLYFLLTHKF